MVKKQKLVRIVKEPKQFEKEPNIIMVTRNLLDDLTVDQTQLKGELANWKIDSKKLPRRKQNDKTIEDTQEMPRPKEEKQITKMKGSLLRYLGDKRTNTWLWGSKGRE